jgi:glycosyltransferase involved in cell wall biosynthesis
MNMTQSVGVVVIGRNEGERLRRCLRSVAEGRRPIVYVDSGSTDGSVAWAERLGVEVVSLNMALPYTAARARNAGLERLRELYPQLKLVQFVDGDCEVQCGWFDAAIAHFNNFPSVVAVCGRRRERFPNRSIFNRLCDLEWDTPIGRTQACGGDAMFRVEPLVEVGGFREFMIAGEEPELCQRLRRNGGAIERLDHEMTVHDAAMTQFSQWWRRAVRAGHAYAEGAFLTRDETNGLWRHEVASTWLWSLLPLLLIVGSWPWLGWWSLGWLLLYLVLFVRIWWRARRRWSNRDALIYSAFCVLAKWAHLQGMLRFHIGRFFGRRSPLMEYKSTAPLVGETS